MSPRKIVVVEDAAEAIGAVYRGRPAGALGDVAAFSFFGNKIITCGEGGMVLARDAALARKIRQLKGQGQDFERRYWFPVVGYNYRMTNIEAALGLAQLDGTSAASCPEAEWLAERGLSLPTWVGMTRRQVARVASALLQAVAGT
jgi:perosamine synthetase